MTSMRALAWLGLVVVAGCAEPTTPPAPDASGSSVCVEPADCDDGRYCNGAERCAPGDPAAGDDGCAPASAPPCASGCDEATDTCDACADPDADGDGENAPGCGGDDCDDDDARRFHGNAEVCDETGLDEDCDAATFGERDADGDGYLDADCCNGAACGDDCDDARSDVHPDLGELCDRADTDCDGAIDEGSTVTCWTDADADRYAPATATSVMACECPVRTTTMAPGPGVTDCDDAVAATSPEGAEVCDGEDNDCDGETDEMLLTSCWLDADNDGHAPLGGAEMMLCACGAGTTPRAPTATVFDCADADAAVSPVGTEGCSANSLDDDCDGTVDDLGGDDWYRDCDLDGYGAAGSTPTRACAMPGSVPAGCGGGGGWAPNAASDCNDASPAVRPGTGAGDTIPAELCDGVDNDCNAATPDGRSETWFNAPCDGADGDACREGVQSCGAGGVDMVCTDPAGETDLEACGGADEDCDGTVDEAAATDAWCDARLASLPHATDATCASGACIPATCEPGWNDCNDVGTGCESACQWRGCTGPRATTEGQCADPIRVTATAALAGPLSCAVRRGGTVACWGGYGAVTTPVVIPGISDAIDVDGTCILRADGTVAQSAGSLSSTWPTVSGVTDAVQVSCRTSVSCAVQAGGTVRCWGENTYGMLGNGTTTGTSSTVSGLTDAVEVSVGYNHVCARRAGGGVLCWGLDDAGQLGDGATHPASCMYGSMPMPCATTPVAVAGITDALQVGAGSQVSCARRAGGAVSCWGYGPALGDGIASHGDTCTPVGGTSTDCSRTPVPVPAVSPATHLETGNRQGGMCVTRSSGVVACWSYGPVADQAGFASPSDLGTDRWVAEGWVCAIDGSGLRCSGGNDFGQLGDGTTIDRASPVPVLSPP